MRFLKYLMFYFKRNKSMEEHRVMLVITDSRYSLTEVIVEDRESMKNRIIAELKKEYVSSEDGLKSVRLAGGSGE